MPGTISRSREGRARGFTLVEMLVVVAIAAMLLGLLMPALAGIRSAARRSGEQSAGRQLMMACQVYANDHLGDVMPGYKTGLRALDETGRPIGDQQPASVAARYPWRLAPYLDYKFESLYTDRSRELLEQMQSREDRADYVYAVSLFPSLGLNATWVGGNQNEQGFSDDALDTYGRFYLTNLSQPHRPDQLMVFASARSPELVMPGAETGYQGSFDGYFEVRSPVLTAAAGDRWADDYESAANPGEFGFLSFRHGGAAVTAFTDGHVDALSPEQLRDMRFWAPGATSADWGLTAR